MTSNILNWIIFWGAGQPQEIIGAKAAKSAQWEYYRLVAKMDSMTKKSIAVQSTRDSIERLLRSYSRFASEVPQNVRDPARTPSTFFRAFTNKIYYDPSPAFRNSRAALLVVIGANDQVVDPASTTIVFENLRQERRDVTVRILPDVGHSLLLMTKDGPRYPEDYLDFVVRWARAQIGHEKK